MVVVQILARDNERTISKTLESLRPLEAEVVVGDPMNPSTVVGPLVSAAQRDLLTAQVNDALRAGARAVTGGAPLDGPGYFYPPTVLVDVPPTSRAGCEELFGPVAAVRGAHLMTARG